MKQRITIPKKVTHSIFQLPCVMGVVKNRMTGFEYHVRLEGRMWSSAVFPGDTLVEDDNGFWHLERRWVDET